MKITALHGFLGRGADWDFLRDAGFDVDAPDLFASMPLPNLRTLHGDVLLGYSMGGRLALDALLAGARFARAVLVSTRVTRVDDARRARDEEWARRFESDAWDDVVRDWNAQPLFAGRDLPRDERHYDRAALAAALREWSPAVVAPAEPRLHELTMPFLVVAGAEDRPYVDEAHRAVAALPDARVAIIEGAAHRVPWERPEAFVAALRRFLD